MGKICEENRVDISQSGYQIIENIKFVFECGLEPTHGKLSLPSLAGA